ncbi:MAG TPA: PilT/PilU family type 4a pilus ATPase [Planctomycetota bacterium]|nr:PilT/PilU family type 4a pilus ATPase [Planctomycetota bacterium]
MKTGGKAAAAERRRKMSEKRAAERLQKILYADVRGKHATFRAMVTNISKTGALLTITDQRFESLTAHGDLSLAGLLIASHFGEGFTIELLEKPVKIEADVVRLFDETTGDRTVLWLGCHFRRELPSQACIAVGLQQVVSETIFAADPPPPPPPAPSAPEGPDIDPRIRVKLFDDAKPAGTAQGSIRAITTRAAEPRAAAAAPGKARVFRSGPALGIREILEMAVERGATDVHAKALSPVRARVGGALGDLGDRALDPEEAEALAREILTPEQVGEFEAEGDIDVSYTLEGGARFRVNVYRTRRLVGLAIRRIADKVPTIEGLGLAPAVTALAQRPRGLVLVSGGAGSGRTTTLAAMVHRLNQTRACHVVTLEDPIEYLHREVKAQVTQREIGDDAEDLATAFRRALRQDPDVIVVDASHDAETMRLAIQAAEMGHLVLAAFHATSAILAPELIVEAFPRDEQRRARLQLAEALQGIVCQTLLPQKGGGTVLAQEVLVVTGAVRAFLREGKAAQVAHALQGGSADGMQTLEGALNDLVARGLITYESALARANHPKLIDREGMRLRPGE